MKTVYIDCSMGCAGDMLTSALLETLEDREGFMKKLNAIGLPGVEFVAEKSEKCGITGTHMHVYVHGEEEGEENHSHNALPELKRELEPANAHCHEHAHRSLSDVLEIIGTMNVSDRVKKDVAAIYALIADAESRVHGQEVSEVHFHEVGAMDAIADITAVCMLFEQLNAGRIIASPVNTGSGSVKCAHGILPVPAPATALLLEGIACYSDSIKGELCTPTGAALLKHFCSSFGNMPVMTVKKAGYGMGKKDFERANCVRVLIGETADSTDTVCELKFNVDDMTAEEIGFAQEMFFEGGALEVFTSAIGMKKSRPGTLVSIMCRESDRESMLKLIFRHTTTIGVRECIEKRYVLEREFGTVHTPYGDVKKKTVHGYDCERTKYEFDDLRHLAREQGVSLREVRKAAEDCDI